MMLFQNLTNQSNIDRQYRDDIGSIAGIENQVRFPLFTVLLYSYPECISFLLDE